MWPWPGGFRVSLAALRLGSAGHGKRNPPENLFLELLDRGLDEPEGMRRHPGKRATQVSVVRLQWGEQKWSQSRKAHPQFHLYPPKPPWSLSWCIYSQGTTGNPGGMSLFPHAWLDQPAAAQIRSLVPLHVWSKL